MKKITLCIPLVVFTVLLLSCGGVGVDREGSSGESCAESSEKVKHTSQTTSVKEVEVATKVTAETEQKTQELLDEGENYKIYEMYAEDEMYYSYEVYDDDQNILDMGCHHGLGGVGISKRGSLLVLRYHSGSPVFHERYYDISRGIVSRFFWRPVQNTDKYVAYFDYKESDKTVLVIQDIFNPEEFYLEIERDFSDFVMKDIAQAEFIESETKLEITYWINPNDQVVTEIIDLERDR
ncbi:MAG: hypothetical protein E7580_07660 [Ruminococcaceae bacterium]|nr:hypothetical protein [Oscillospiraceae bacterium]